MAPDAAVATDTIASRHNPVVARCRAAARGDAPDTILLEGPRLLAEAMRTGASLGLVAYEARLLDEPRGDAVRTAAELRAAGTRVLRVTAGVMAALSPARQPSGVVALARRPIRDASRLVGRAAFALAAVNIQDPGNLGALIRVAHAGDADACLVCGASADPYGWKALRGSMGSTLHLPVARLTDANEALRLMRSSRLRLVAAVPRGAPSLYEANLDPPIALLLGSEARGLPQDLLDQVDDRLSIPMADGVNSLNVAVAAGIVAYERVRRRRIRP